MHMWLQFFSFAIFVLAIFCSNLLNRTIESCNWNPFASPPSECQFHLQNSFHSWVAFTWQIPWNSQRFLKPNQVNTFNCSIWLRCIFITIHFLLHLHGCSENIHFDWGRSRLKACLTAISTTAFMCVHCFDVDKLTHWHIYSTRLLDANKCQSMFGFRQITKTEQI